MTPLRCSGAQLHSRAAFHQSIVMHVEKPKPYWSEPGVTIYCGDSRELLPAVADGIESCITDPVWPRPSPLLVGAEDPYGLLAAVLRVLPASLRRIVLVMGRTQDPRFLTAVPASFEFRAVCWLERLPPSFYGRVVNDAEVAYCFGDFPDRFPGGQQCLPGGCRSHWRKYEFARGTGANRSHRAYLAAQQRSPHPAMRQVWLTKWLVNWLGGLSVIDPFLGSGTTALACKELAIPMVGIEIEERYCELAVKRIAQGTLDLQTPPELPQQHLQELLACP